MASVIRQSNGRKLIQFIAADGKRATIRLGKISVRQAEAVKVKVENLVGAKLSAHAADDETARWVANLDAVLAEKLANVGLMEHREHEVLGDFIKRYIRSRVDVKPNTVRCWRQTLRHLTDFFGAEKSIRDVSKGDAKDWRLWLIGKGLADATVRKHCGFAKHFLAEAIDRELIQRNPFAGIASSPIGNSSRQYFVTHDEIEKVFATCPDDEWRLIVALSRYGGLRCPSETLLLRWGDINWEQKRFTVQSPKTERHVGHESRVVPLFPELLPYIEAVFEQAEPGTEFLIERYRNATGNLRTQLTRIVKRAGLKPWPRIFHNLRASRQTELEAQFPTHVVCAWIGNSPLVAREHYLQIRDEDFERAVDPQALQNALQQSHETPRTASQREERTRAEYSRKLEDSAWCVPLRHVRAGVDGNRTHPATFQPPQRV